MNTQIFTIALLEFILSFGISLGILYFTFKLLNKFIVKKHNVPYKNIAFGIITAGIFISVSYLIASVKEVLVETIRVMEQNPVFADNLWQYGAQYFLIYLLISVVVILLTNVSSIGLFTIMTKGINEIEEIKKENIAVSIITATLMICISFMVKDSLMLMLQSFIPYPELPSINF